MLSEKEKQEILRSIRRDIEEVKNQPVSESSRRLKELHSIARQLDTMGYVCDLCSREIIDVINKNNIDVSKLKFPQGSYEGFKKDVARGVYAFSDYDLSDMEITDEERTFIEDGIASGSIFRFY